MVNQNIGNFVVAQPESPVNEDLDKEIGVAISEEKASPLLDCGNQIESINNDKMELTSDSNVMPHHPDDEENNLRNIIISRGTAITDYNADQADQRNKNFLTQRISDCEVDLTLSEPSPNKLHVDTSKLLRGTSEIIAGGSQTSDKDVCRACEAQFLMQYEQVSPLQHILPQGGAVEAAPTTEPKSENKARNDDSLAARAILKTMEFSDENDLPNLVRTEALEQTSERPAWENSIPLQKFPTKSWMDLYKKKGKGKVLSDGNVSVRFLNDVEDSHESVESCNSAGSSTKSKRRFNPAESINDSKRGKREPEDKPDFTSAIRHNSSFMNWISNMVKGYRDGPSLDLSLDNSDSQKQNVQEIITCNKHSDDGCVGAGFQAMFQSLYVPASRKPSRRVSEAQYYKEASDQLVLANSRSDKILALAYPSDAATSGNLVLPSQLRIVPVNSEPLQKVHETNCRSYEGGSRFFGSLSKQRYATPAKRSPNLLSESKTVNDKSAKNSTLDSLWITRFCAKNATTSLNLDERNQNENRGDTNPSRINNIQVSSAVHSTENTFGIRENFIHKECDDLQKRLENLSENMEESTPHKQLLQHNHQNTHKLDVISPCTICKSPDEIASIFAMRVDALKQISLAGTKGGTSSQVPTCLFCGKHGHELQYCSDTTEAELEGLLCISSTHASVEGSCFCIICFQLDHWANTCPRNSTRRKQVLGRYNSVGNLNVKLGEGDEQDSISSKKRAGDPLYITKRLNIPSSKAPPVCAGIDSKTWTGKCNFGRRMSDSNQVRKCMDPKSEGHASKRRKYFPMCNVFGKHMEAVPNGTLDYIKRLRLSRLEILKCMNSRTSLSYLNGFYIRLRVGKLEEGQEGTGYYVASITGEQPEVSAKNSNKYISVNAGGTQSLVGIQYASNHDFLEDELIAWWCRILETGEKVPTQEELKSKFEERMKLGFC